MRVRSKIAGTVDAERVVRLPRPLREAIAEQVNASYPLEACGVLIGEPGDVARPSVVRELRATDNVAAGDRRRRYAVAPRALLAAQRQARAAGLEVIGYYHSHPDSSAVPSATDLEGAWPGVSYLIASVSGGVLDEIRSWRRDLVSETFIEERVELSTP